VNTVMNLRVSYTGQVLQWLRDYDLVLKKNLVPCSWCKFVDPMSPKSFTGSRYGYRRCREQPTSVPDNIHTRPWLTVRACSYFIRLLLERDCTPTRAAVVPT
jgi:hypothetical protein